jgi:hypothetical protein
LPATAASPARRRTWFYGGHVIVYNAHLHIILDVFGGISF